MALRGHASIQGSTDIPTLYDLLPGYLHMPRAARGGARRSSDYIATGGADRGWWSHFDKYIVSLLKAWFGDAATAENDFGFARAAEDHRQPLALPDDDAHARRRRRRACSSWARTRPSARRTPACSAARSQAEVARRPRPRRDRDRDVLARRARGRSPASCAPRTSRPRSS